MKISYGYLFRLSMREGEFMAFVIDGNDGFLI